MSKQPEKPSPASGSDRGKLDTFCSLCKTPYDVNCIIQGCGPLKIITERAIDADRIASRELALATRREFGLRYWKAKKERPEEGGNALKSRIWAEIRAAKGPIAPRVSQRNRLKYERMYEQILDQARSCDTLAEVRRQRDPSIAIRRREKAREKSREYAAKNKIIVRAVRELGLLEGFE